jgi:hypothetical protein
MPGLVPGTHVLLQPSSKQGVGGRDKPGHDEGEIVRQSEWNQILEIDPWR